MSPHCGVVGFRHGLQEENREDGQGQGARQKGHRGRHGGGEGGVFGRYVGQGLGLTGWEARAVEDMEAVLCGASCLFSVQPGRQGTGGLGGNPEYQAPAQTRCVRTSGWGPALGGPRRLLSDSDASV